MDKVKSLIISGWGINCEKEMLAAWKFSGASADVIHLKDLLTGKISIFDYDIINFPGGFSFGDELGGGRIFANRIKYKKLPSGGTLLKNLHEFVESGRYLLGICNGFQILMVLGLLPGVSLIPNQSGKFEDRWVRCKVPEDINTPLLPKGMIINLPVRHGEGKIALHNQESKNISIALEYVDQNGVPTEIYPQNPNGSWKSCAGLSDTTGRVLGIMPHPEAFLSLFNHPNWPAIQRKDATCSEKGEGLHLFEYMTQVITKEKEIRAHETCAH